MINAIASVPGPGPLLREWRAARRFSQLDLALAADISARHLSYVETGKSQPSREMVVRLADALALPLRERNALLQAAGYVAQYPETPLDAPELARIQRAIDFIIAQQEPYPAFVLDRHWNILRANAAALRVNGFLLAGRASPHANMLRHVFDPTDLRAALVNWEEVAGDLVHHLHAEIAAHPSDPVPRQLLEEILAHPGVPQRRSGAAELAAADHALRARWPAPAVLLQHHGVRRAARRHPGRTAHRMLLSHGRRHRRVLPAPGRRGGTGLKALAVTGVQIRSHVWD
ncbi:helix-turn-helix domain-containing protein [Pseudoxanthomonas sp. 22568]|uniref:helix-turn-helix domain-containing protein n=1 Tax=Pseudoxanthomonas sp. 22568 TaxID=3453945 RepID=UPI003F857E4B